MTPQEVREMVAEIDVDSDEVAHATEDTIRAAVLVAIAGGADNPAALAAEALKTGELKFARWCA